MPKTGVIHIVARRPIATARTPASSVVISWAIPEATTNVEDTRPSARSSTSVWRTTTSEMS